MEKVLLDWENMGEYTADPIEYRFIDRVEVIPGKESFGTKAVSSQDWYFKMHYPDNPVMPEGFLMEALMQTGVFIITTLPEKPDPLMMFHSCESLEVFGSVHPGDILDTHVELKSYRRGIAKFHGKVRTRGGVMPN